jgi:undecaprenyl-diphosphatase
MAAATGYKLWEIMKLHPEALHNPSNLKSLLVGNVVAFVIAFLTMRFFVDFLKKHGFRFFGWYRICAGIVFLLMVKMNQIR